MSQAAAPESIGKLVVELLPLDRIHESKSNPRKTFRGIEELAEDLKIRGILQPVLVRAGRNGNADGYELVFGARRFRAAKLAKLAVLPAFVRELTDEQVLETQLVENSKREDCHPLEEADGYRRLHEEFGYSIEDLAAAVGKSRSAVYERIKLCALVPAAREAFFAGKLSASTALLVARIPDKELQQRAVKDLTTGQGVEPMSYRQAVDHIHSKYMLALKDAPFDVTDAALVAKAGACAACPKRTGNQRELFGDVKSADVCTDPKCYAGKVDAVWALKVAKAKEAGQEVLEEKAAKEIFKYGGLDYSAGLKKLDDEEWVDGKHKTVRQIVGKDAPTVLARDPSTGKIHELVKRELVQKALRGETEPQSPAEKARREKERRQREEDKTKDEIRDLVTKRIVAEVVSKIEARQMSRALWVVLAQELAHDALEYGMADDLVERRTGKNPEKDDAALDDFEESIPAMSEGQLRGLVFEATILRGDAVNALYRGEKDGTISRAARAIGVDEKKVAARVKAEAKAAEDAKKKPAPLSKTERIADAVKTIKKLAAPGKPKAKKKPGKPGKKK